MRRTLCARRPAMRRRPLTSSRDGTAAAHRIALYAGGGLGRGRAGGRRRRWPACCAARRSWPAAASRSPTTRRRSRTTRPGPRPGSAAPGRRSGSRCSATRPPPGTASTATATPPARSWPRHLRGRPPPGARHERRRGRRRVAPSCRPRSTRSAGAAPELAVIMIGANDVTARGTKPAVAVPLPRGRRAPRCGRSAPRSSSAPAPTSAPIRPLAQPLRAYARRLSRQMARAQTVAVVRAGGRTVSLGDLLGPLFMTSLELFSDDRFHPSAAGYAEAAPAVLPSAWTRSACAPAPGRPARSPPAGSSRWRRPRPRPSPAPAPRSPAPSASAAARAARGPLAQLRRRRPAPRRRPRPKRPRRPSHRPGDVTFAPRVQLTRQPGRRQHRGRTRTKESPMPEAVIVSTARSPIGRAGKGSLVSIRPDDLAAQIVRAALDKVPALDPHDIDDLMMGCGQPGGEAGFNIGRTVAVQLGYDFLPGTTVNRYCSSSLQTLADGLPRHQGRRGRRRSSPPASRRCRASPTAAPTAGPTPTTRCTPRPRQRTAKVAESGASRVARPARGRPAARRLHRHGPDRRERRPAQGRQPRGHGPLRRPLAEPGRGRRSPTASGPRDITPITLPDGTVVSQGRRPARRRHLRGGLRPQAGVPPGRPGHRRQLLRAQRRRRRGRRS